MSGESLHSDQLSAGSAQAILERALIAEYLLGRGYLMSDLAALPPQAAKELMGEACRFADGKIAEIEAKARFRQEIRLPISLN